MFSCGTVFMIMPVASVSTKMMHTTGAAIRTATSYAAPSSETNSSSGASANVNPPIGTR